MTPATLKPWIELARLTVGLARELLSLQPDCRSERQAAALAALRGEAAGKAAAASSAAASPLQQIKATALCSDCYWKNALSRRCGCPGGPFQGVILGDNAPACPRLLVEVDNSSPPLRASLADPTRRCGNCSNRGENPAGLYCNHPTRRRERVLAGWAGCGLWES